MPIQARTYTCGGSGGVRKFVDFAFPWQDISLSTNGIPNAFGSELFDIKTSPSDGEKVFVVGDIHECGLNWYGVGVTSNGGTLWQVPAGNYITLINAALCYHKWYEVSVVDSNVAYVCGSVGSSGSGTVIKTVDGGLTFNSCSPLPTTVVGMDVTSIHFITPLIGVIGLNNYVLKTIDGGVTWTVMNGGQPLSTTNPFPGTLLPVGNITGIHISNDEGKITGIGLDFIVETAPVSLPNPPGSAGMGVDSWQQNFYPGSGFGVPIGQHLSYNNSVYSNDSFIAISGDAELGIYSLNAGQIWTTTPAPGYNPTGTGFSRRAAHFYKTDPPSGTPKGFYNKNSTLYLNLNGFDPASESVSDLSPYDINAVWTWYLDDESPPGEPCYLITSCDGATSFDALGDFAGLVNGGIVFTLPGYSGCWTASQKADCTNPVFIPVIGNATTCAGCIPDPPVCYLLEDCEGNLADIITTSDFSFYIGQVVNLAAYPDVCWQVSISNTCTGSVVLNTQVTASFTNCLNCTTTCYRLVDCSSSFPPIITTTDLSAYLGQTITLDNYPGICWIVQQAPNCDGSSALTSTIVDTFFDCVACLQICYRLVDCAGVKPDIITDLDLSAFIGQVIKIVGCDSVCYIVSTSNTCQGSETVELATSFGTCELCFAAPKPSLAPLRMRKIQPNYGEEDCSVELVERTNCKFSNQVYAKLLTKKYGVTPCIDDEFDKWLIKKELLELNLLYDSEACIVPEAPETCDEVIIVPPTPGPCPNCSGIVVTFSDALPVSCGTPTSINVEIVYQAP